MQVDSELKDLKARVSDRDYLSRHGFEVLRRITSLLSEQGHRTEAQELVLRLMEHKSALKSMQPILDAIIRNLGLFPYLNASTLSTRDRFAYEFHRPENLSPDIVFHAPQYQVYRTILDGQSVTLSAPMSFGKSLIVDALIASGKYRNIVIVVPTIALIDETRRRLSRRFKGQFKVITSVRQASERRNIYVLTQERVLEFEKIQQLDLFVIDEFYKLSPERLGDERSILLNQAFYKLRQWCKQFYLLGPNINNVSPDFSTRVPHRFLAYDYHTVALESKNVNIKGGKLAALLNLCRGLNEPTLIFCASPAKATAVTMALIEANIGAPASKLLPAANWVSTHYHPEWHFAKAISMGIGVHHGRIPRALAQYVVRQFNCGNIRFLVCTSTLIEGVNTKARNVVIYDNQINRKDIDLFTFNNIRGRSGRMFQHFVGTVYLFQPPPQDELPIVDVPVYTQSKNATDSLLVQIEDAELSGESRKRIEKFKNHPLLGFATIKQNRGIDPELQIKVAEVISGLSINQRLNLSWTGIPNGRQLRECSELIWHHLRPKAGSQSGVRSVQQLVLLINELRKKPTTRQLIDDQFGYWKDADKSVQTILDFIRLWATHNFPKRLRALDLIQRDVLPKLGMRAGNYEVFAFQVENLFLDPSLVSMDEFGVPIDLARKAEKALSTDGDIDEALRRLKSLSLTDSEFTPFERELLLNARESI